MDLYQVLRVSPNSNQKEIEEAYQRLIKECRYNVRLNRRDIDLAYRVLGNPTQKALYDSKLKQYDDRGIRKILKRRKKRAPILRPATQKQQVIIFLVLIVITLGFYAIRFGYHLKSFEIGDVLYMKQGDQQLGRVVAIEKDHNFGTARYDAYLVATGTEKRWLPQDVVKIYCYKLK